MLKDAKVRAAKLTDKAYKLYDADGLFLFVYTRECLAIDVAEFIRLSATAECPV